MIEIRTEPTRRDDPHGQAKKVPTELENMREHYRAEAFRLMLYILVIFGVPAALAVLLGRYLDGTFATGKVITIVLLVVAFVSSWIVMIIRYRKLDRELKAVDQAIKEEREQKAMK